MNELTREFVAESREGLDRMERCLTELEGHPRDRALVDEIFRSVHSMKGATGFLGFGRLEALAHAGETLLSSLRADKLEVTAELISGLLELLDSLRGVLRLIEVTGGEGQRRTDEDFATIGRLVQLNDAGLVSAALAPVAAASVNHRELRAAAPEAALPSSEPSAEAVERRVSVQPADRTVRVDVEVLNRLMNQVGELVVTRNQLLRLAAPNERLTELGRRLDIVTSDLRETVMRLRLQPIGHLFGKFPRVVRDLARACGKQVRLEVQGQDTGLDKSLLEAIRDPLTHALRNAIDHGIEAPRDRVLAGKTAEGRIRLRAFQQNGSVIVELQDDGAGISGRKVAAKAVERGLISAPRAESMSEKERVRLVFAPGLSTADEVTNVSGRGVGMDVVQANVEKIGGTVQIETVAGAGTTLRLTLPLTLAILPSLVVRAAGQSFAVPQGALLELIAISEREFPRALERVGQTELYSTRDGLIPVLRLAALMESNEANAACGHHIAVVESEGCRFGLLVDDVVAPEEIVVKPVSAVLRRSGLFSGAALIGSGELAFVLDVHGLRSKVGLQPCNHTPTVPLNTGSVASDPAGDSVLFYEVDPGVGGAPETRYIPLRSLERIETVAANQIQHVYGKTVLRMGQDLLDLTDECSALTKTGASELTVLVCDQHGRRHAILVNRVLELCDQPGAVRSSDGKFALINNRIAPVYQSDLCHLMMELA